MPSPDDYLKMLEDARSGTAVAEPPRAAASTKPKDRADEYLSILDRAATAAPTVPQVSPELSPGPGPSNRIQSAMDPQQAINAAAKARGAAMLGEEPLAPPSGAPLTNPRMMQIGGGQNTITPSASAGGIVNEPERTPEGSKTPFYVPERAVAGEYGPVVQRSFQRATEALQDTRTQRFPWTKIAAETPPEDRAATLMAVAQLSAQKGEFRDMGTLEKMGTGVKRDVQRFKTAVDNTIGDLVGRVFGAKTGMAAGKEATDKRLFERALEGAASTGDPLVNPEDPFWKQWMVGASEMSATMAAGAVTGGALPAMGVWFAPIYDDARDELLEAGVSPDAARVGGAISAAVQAAVETFNLNPFKPKGAKDPVAGGIRKYVKDYVKGWTKELSEEFVQGGVQAATMAAATQLDEAAPDLALGDQLKQKMGDALAAGGPLAVMMLPGFIGGLPRSMKESAARRWMVNNPQRVEEIAAKEQPSRTDLPEIPTAKGRAEFAAEVAKAKPRYRYNNKTGKLDPVLTGTEQPWQMTRAQFEATGEDLEHGTSRQFEMFEPGVQDRYGKREVDKFYFTNDPKVSNTFANSGGYRQVAYDQFAETSEAATPEETLAQMRTDLNKSIAKGNVLATIDDATGDLKRVEKAEDVSDDALRDGDVRLYSKNRWPRVIKTKVYGRTLDLFGGDVPEAFKAKFPNWKEFTKEAFPNFSSEFVRGIAQWAAENGYGKVRVRDTYESGYQSIMALPEFIGFNADPHRAFVERAMNQGREVPPAVLADYPDLAERAAKTRPPQEPPSAPPADIQPPPPGYGRPELANPGETQYARDAMDDIDEARKQAGVPQVLPNEEVRQRAAQLVEQDYQGQLQRALRSDEAPNPELQAVAAQVINAESVKGITDADAFLRAKELDERYRERRTDVARELQIGVDQWMTPEQRLASVGRAITTLPVKLQKKVDSARRPAEARKNRKAAAERDIEDAWKRLGAAFGGSLSANPVQATVEGAKAAADLVVAYAKKGIYKIEDIIADIEATRGTKLNGTVRQALRDAAEERKGDIRIERVSNEADKSAIRQKAITKGQEKAEKLIRDWHGKEIQQYKADLVNLFGIDLDSANGLSIVETSTALRYLQAYVGDNFDKFLEWQRFALLSGIDTQAVNESGNLTTAAYVFGLRYPTEQLGRLLRHPSNFKEIAAETQAVLKTLLSSKRIRQAQRVANRAWKYEVDVWELEHSQRPIQSSVDYTGRGLSIRGRKGRVVRSVQRWLLSRDNFYKAWTDQAFLAITAHRIAQEEGFNLRTEPDAFHGRVDQLMSDPTSQAWVEAEEMLHESVMQGHDKVIDTINRIKRDNRAFQVIFPVITTAYNGLKFGVKGTPGIGQAAFLAFDLPSGNARRISKSLAHQAVGAMFWYLLALYNRPDDENAKFRMTGTEDAIRRKRPLADISKSKPMSFYVYGVPVSYRRLGWMATLFGTAVDTIEEFKRAETPTDAIKVANTYFSSLVRSTKEQTFLQNMMEISDMIAQLSEAENSSQGFNAVLTWAKSFTVSRAIPNIWRSISRDLDPYKKDASVTGERTERLKSLARSARVQAGFDTADDPLVYDLWGDPISMRTFDDAPLTDIPWRIMDFVARELNFADMNEQRPFVGTELLVRWNTDHPSDAYWPTAPHADFSDGDGGRTKMTSEQKAQFLRLSGQYAKSIVTKVNNKGKLSAPENVTATDRDIIKDAIENGRSVVRGMLSAAWKQNKTLTDEEVKRKLRIE